MELRHLRYCIAVAEEGSFTRAASRLRLAQQAVSRQIADLERELGVKLFERGARGARLTPAGIAFVEDARGAIGQTVRAALRARAQNISGQLRLAYSYLTPPHFTIMGDAIAHFHQACPELGVDIRHLSTGDQTVALREGNLDVAFGYLMSPDSGDIVDELFRDDPLIGVILPASHPLATNRDQLWLHDLGALPLLMIAREVNPEVYDGVIAALAERDLNPELATIQAVGVPAVSMVSQGGCWKLASKTMIEEIGAEPGAVFRPFADTPLPFGLWLRRLGRSASSLSQQFVDYCCEKHVNGHHATAEG